MKVFVIGGTGAIGGHAVPALVRAAHTVTALARTPEKAALLSQQGASPITESIFDRAALTEAAERVRLKFGFSCSSASAQLAEIERWTSDQPSHARVGRPRADANRRRPETERVDRAWSGAQSWHGRPG